MEFKTVVFVLTLAMCGVADGQSVDESGIYHGIPLAELKNTTYYNQMCLDYTDAVGEQEFDFSWAVGEISKRNKSAITNEMFLDASQFRPTKREVCNLGKAVAEPEGSTVAPPSSTSTPAPESSTPTTETTTDPGNPSKKPTDDPNSTQAAAPAVPIAYWLPATIVVVVLIMLIGGFLFHRYTKKSGLQNSCKINGDSAPKGDV